MSENMKVGLLASGLLPLALGLQLAVVWVVSGIAAPPASPTPPAPTVAQAAPPAAVPPRETPAQTPAPAEPLPPVAEALSGWQERHRSRNPNPESATTATPAAEAAPGGEAAPPASADVPAPAAGEVAALEDPTGDAGGLLHQADWLARRNPRHYTLQVETAPGPADLRDFVRDRELPRPQASFRSFWSGRQSHVHALVVGDYEDWDSANRAARDLARRHTGLKPWIRRFGDIQEQMQ